MTPRHGRRRRGGARPGRWCPGQLAEADPRVHAGVADVAGAPRSRRRCGRGRRGRARGRGPGQLIRRLDAVEEGDDEGVGAEEWAQRSGRLGHLPGFDGDEDHVGRAQLGGVVGGRAGWMAKSPAMLVTRRPVFADGPEVVAPGDEGDVLPGLREATAEVGADGAGAEHGDGHQREILAAKRLSGLTSENQYLRRLWFSVNITSVREPHGRGRRSKSHAGLHEFNACNINHCFLLTMGCLCGIVFTPRSRSKRGCRMSAPHHLRCLGQPASLFPKRRPCPLQNQEASRAIDFPGSGHRTAPHRRDRLAEVLWPRSAIAEARHSLATALSILRPRLPMEALQIESGSGETPDYRTGD